jgi:tripartite-type tricarboxylate transporter receptor subunit TctC
MLAKQSLRDRLTKLDISPDFIRGQALQAKLATEIQSWTKFIDAKGIKAE